MIGKYGKLGGVTQHVHRYTRSCGVESHIPLYSFCTVVRRTDHVTPTKLYGRSSARDRNKLSLYELQVPRQFGHLTIFRIREHRVADRVAEFACWKSLDLTLHSKRPCIRGLADIMKRVDYGGPPNIKTSSQPL